MLTEPLEGEPVCQSRPLEISRTSSLDDNANGLQLLFCVPEGRADRKGNGEGRFSSGSSYRYYGGHSKGSVCTVRAPCYVSGAKRRQTIP